MKIHPAGAKLFHKNRHDKAVSCSFHLCKHVQKGSEHKAKQKNSRRSRWNIRLGKISDRKNNRGGNRGETAALGRQPQMKNLG